MKSEETLRILQRHLASLAAASSALTLWAATPDPWPSDFWSQIAAHDRQVRQTSTSDAPSAASALDAQPNGVGCCVVGTDDDPFDSYYNFSQPSRPGRLNSRPPSGNCIIIR